MASPNRPRLTPVPARRFGITMAVVLGLLAALVWWREAPRAFGFLAVLSAFFALGAFAAPRWLVPIERVWLRFGEALGAYVTTPLLFTIFWVIGFVPIGILRRTLGRSPLARDPGAASYWRARAEKAPDVARSDLERQF